MNSPIKPSWVLFAACGAAGYVMGQRLARDHVADDETLRIGTMSAAAAMLVVGTPFAHGIHVRPQQRWLVDGTESIRSAWRAVMGDGPGLWLCASAAMLGVFTGVGDAADVRGHR